MIKKSKQSKKSDIKSRLNTSFVFRPDQSIRFSWEVFMVVSLGILGILIPYATAFAQDDEVFILKIDYYSISIFSIDILVTLNSGIYIKGELYMKRNIIIKEYLKFWFWVDILSTIPFDDVMENFVSKEKIAAVSSGKHFNMLKMMKLLKLIRLSRLKYLILRIEDRIISKKGLSLIKLIKSALYLFLVAHFCACLMFFISRENLSPDSFASLIEFSINGSINDPFIMYIYCLYWAFVTMASIGYGDLSPKTTSERILGIITMNITSVTFGYIIGNVGTIIEKHTSKDKERQELLVKINKIMKIHSLSEEIRSKSRKYINYIYTTSKNQVDLKVLLGVLSQPLREEIFAYINGNTVLKLGFMNDLSPVCISRISKVLKPQVNSPGDIIFNENEDSTNMFFITKGRVVVVDLKTQSAIKYLSSKDHFGEIGLFSSKPRCATIQSANFLETLCLQKLDLSIISAQFPEMNQKLQDLHDSTLSGDLSKLKILCFLCKNLGHIAKDCKKMTEMENLQKNWLKKRRESQTIKAGEYSFNKKYIREFKKHRVKDLNTRAVWGVKRRLKDLYPKKRKFIKTVKGYIKNMPRKSDDELSMVSERFSLFSNESDFSFLNSLHNYQYILSSSSDSDSIIVKEKQRSVSFDTTLIESSVANYNDV
ncbi:hypothetical protein SteCoe_7449 [Stentor coeruleus]|uniref:Cyclic nucleotide-binding domain-containing protein n=1 Tax=Stentor coeruleus TaxID=5963 RepID=A0A1R2CMP9_9CILI|nr:hypothetical protein SteCoe_7449 [Stentor coeruleus]